MRDIVLIIKNHLRGIVAALDTAEKRIEEEKTKKRKRELEKIKIEKM